MFVKPDQMIWKNKNKALDGRLLIYSLPSLMPLRTKNIRFHLGRPEFGLHEMVDFVSVLLFRYRKTLRGKKDSLCA